MFRSGLRRISTSDLSPPVFSVLKDKQYLQHRLALLGKRPHEVKKVLQDEEGEKEGGGLPFSTSTSTVPMPHDNTNFSPLTSEQVQRFTSSLGSAEQLFNQQAGAIPTNVVDEETGRVIGSTQLNPTRYGDWEKHGRCCDF